MNGEAKQCTRALGGFGFQAGSLNHSGFVFDNGDTIGFFDDGKVRSDDGHSSSEYQCKGSNIDDSKLRSAIDKLRPQWEGKYNFFAAKHCQSFVESVLDIVKPKRQTRRGLRRPR